MKKTLTFLTLVASMTLLSACGDDNDSVTTQELECNANSYYDYDDGKWYFSYNDRRECKSSANYPNGDLGCPAGQIAARVSRSGLNYPNGYGHFPNHGIHHGINYGNSGYRNIYRSNISNGFGWDYSANFCWSLGNSRPCPIDHLSSRDRGRYDIHRDIYPSHNGVRIDHGGYRLVCVPHNDRNLHTIGGYLYYEYTDDNDFDLSAKEALTLTAVGVLIGIAISN